jgi:hypothetical protein
MAQRRPPIFKLLHRVADRQAPRIEAQLVSTLTRGWSSVNRAELIRALEAHDAYRTMSALGADNITATHPVSVALRRALTRQLLTVAQQAGQVAELGMPAELHLRFDLTNPRAMTWAQGQSATLVREIGDDALANLRSLVARGFSEGITVKKSARAIALELRQAAPLTQGLTQRQWGAVENFRSRLVDADVPLVQRMARVEKYAAKLLRQRAMTIGRTETIAASSAGQDLLWQQAVSAGYIDAAQARQQWLVTPDDRLCPICEAIPGMNPDGVELGGAFATPAGPVTAPPVHPNCFVGSTQLDLQGLTTERTFDRSYHGHVVTVVLSSGHELTVTPNHPIATPHGWVTADELHEGSHVFGSRRAQGKPFSVNPDDAPMPTRADDFIKAFLCSRDVTTATVPVAAEDFHGDGMNKEIAVVGTNRALKLDGQAPGFQRVSKFQLDGRAAAQFLLACSSNLASVFQRLGRAPYGTVCVPHLLRALPYRHLRPLQRFALVLIANMHAVLLQETREASATDPVPLSKLVARCAADIFEDNVVRILRIPFSGHVYNLQTSEGWYIGNGVYTSNCRCAKVLDIQQQPLRSAA